ncbi:MAG: hypothetical protein DIU74_003545 [Pseudomonadota bacterium]|nr:MAG: hypothetical protein DIU74_12630 [Pseudomonadota bacterium]
MLREITGLRQDEPGLTRRWFHDDYFDLFLWQDAAGTLAAFELCYGDDAEDRALVWKGGGRFYHDGERIAKNEEEARQLVARFRGAAAALPAALRAALDARLDEYLALRDRLPARRRRFRRADWQAHRESR